ncbi:hypothetical protein F2P81_015669 [Scophthalmus maximus]|uniref:Uncharacterized protein n=1 Tax=Scophthalmus maximus TaxID=52904 RepID=A0A6A4SJF8_SCOMX|nr:hypothetical protein F2P81_015669 [Scophthalmus maximus]
MHEGLFQFAPEEGEVGVEGGKTRSVRFHRHTSQVEVIKVKQKQKVDEKKKKGELTSDAQQRHGRARPSPRHTDRLVKAGDSPCGFLGGFFTSRRPLNPARCLQVVLWRWTRPESGSSSSPGGNPPPPPRHR